MKLSRLAGFLIPLSMLSVSLMTPPVQAQDPCGYVAQTQAEQELREVKVEKFGVLLKVPKNYRTIASGSGKTQYIRILNPATYEYLECAQKNQVPVEGFLQTLLVTIIPTNGRYRTITEFLQSQPRKTHVVNTLKVGGQPAVLGLHERGIGTTATVAALTPDKKYAIEIEADYGDSSTSAYDPNKVSALRDFMTVVDNFKFGSPSAAAPQTRPTSVSTAQVAPTFRRLVPQIKAGLPPSMAMRLPATIEGVAYDGKKFPIYGKILPRDDDQFTIQLVTTPNCNVRVCMVGYIGVAPLGSDSLPSSGDKMESINLTATLRGKYLYRTFPGSAASPPANIVVWEQGGYAYIVSSSMNKQKVLDIAKSMANGVVIQSQR
jgi:hypothetical protein